MDLSKFESKKFVIMILIVMSIGVLSAFSALTPAAAGAFTTLGLAYMGGQSYLDSLKKGGADGS